MDPFRNPPPDSLAAARLHVQALTDCGLPREALLRALLENYGPSEADAPMSMEMDAGHQNQPQQDQQQQQQQLQQLQQNPLLEKMAGATYNTRLSVSTTSSRSSGRASVLSTAASVSSVSTQATQEMPPPLTLQTPTSAPAPALTPAPVAAKSNNRGTSKPQGAYWCTFCDVAFQRKFDWKRHEEEFHERYKRYPCPNCNRIFWGANSFNQHHKNAHGCTTCPHADAVVRYTHRKQAWACGFCGGFLSSRDRYFDHVARHYEDGCNKQHWNHSLVVYGLLHQPIINHAWKELDAALYGHLPRGQQPMLEWNIELTGHAQGFLEGESPGKLQDLLEFFNETRDDPRFLARLAHDQAVILLRHEMPSPVASTPAPRPISEPPKPRPKPSMASSTKHLSTPQHGSSITRKYDGHPILKRQRSIAPAPSNFSRPHVLPGTSHQLDQSTLMSPFPQTILEAPEGDFFDMAAAQMQQAQHLTGQQQHHPHPQQHQQPSHQRHHNPNHLTTIPNLHNSIFEDWSSIAATVVDESAFSMSEGWETDLGSPHPRPGG
ncbi:hypothetical protein B0T26DRAFT_736635 [Lasiosphaeria miniovina]|uniref:C2H2-type domain-containing protein n=1 Tax=Lasiosphaeria miniovina TaxID=1954250 RepID=A0AA40BGF6_9PEZI|nr:uncharacterized protein B0T26DRAFT_736635 [Lasiosphaeria miniovina]KAK0733782.1 hypothetical protein B0T26DRAFT_736635 [Lasiosphaeria miniovina]